MGDEDLSNDSVLEGGDEIMTGIDEVLSSGGSMAKDAVDTSKGADAAQQDQTQQQDDTSQQQQQDETADQKLERERNERGQFTAKQKEEADQKAAAEQAQQGKEYPTEIKGATARKHFDVVRGERDAEKRRADSLNIQLKDIQRQLEDVKSKSGTAAPEVKVLQEENANLKAQLEDREKVISYKAVELSKPFQEQVTQPQKDALEILNQVAETYKLDGRQLDAVLQEPNKFKRLEMLGDLTAELPERSAFVKDELKQAVEKYVQAEGVAKSLYDKAKGNREFAEREQQQAEAKAALERQQQYQKANTEVDSILKEKFPEIAGDEGVWKGITEKAFKIADFDKMPAKSKAFANFASWMVQPLMEKYRAEKAAHEETKAIMAKRNGTNLSPTQGRDSTVRKGGDEEEMGGDYMSGLLGGIDDVLSGTR